MNRGISFVLVPLVALLAGGAGVLYARKEAPVAAASPAQSAALAKLLALELPDTKGVKQPLAQWKGKVLVVNFWATWCPPCVDELPLINAFYRAHAPAGWQVLGLAVDQAAPVSRFLQRLPLDFPVVLAGLSGTELGRSLGNVSGGLPFTVVFGAEGAVLHRKLGKLSESDLAQWAGLG